MNARTANMHLTSRGVRIGIAMIPVQRIELTRDALALQVALLSKPQSKDYWPGVALAFAAVFLAATKLAGWWPA